MSNSSAVYTGRWTDWSKGKVRGDQITMSNASSNVLVAFIAVFIIFVGGVTWTVLAYVIHQSRVSTHAPKNGLHFQTQALLRNDDAPATFAYKMIKTGFAWRKNRGKTFAVTFSLVGLALTVYSVFLAAGLLLSMAASTGDVLLQGTNCGFTDWDTLANASFETQWAYSLAYNAWGIQEFSQGYEYSQICYPNEGLHGSTSQINLAPAADCTFFVKPVLDYTKSFPGICPFGEEICLNTSDVVQFDTGYLDTRADLGRNTKDEDRLLFRRVTTCAPIVTEGFTDGFKNVSDFGNVAMYEYGPNEIQPEVTPWSNYFNATFIYPYASYAAQDQPYQILVATTDAYVTNGTLQMGINSSPFVPDPRLAPKSNSVTLIFLANRAYYPFPVTDPWFQATTSLPETDPRSGGQPLYYSEQPGSVVGCIEDVELCNPNLQSKSCITWDDYYQYGWDVPSALDTVNPLKLNDHQLLQSYGVAGCLADASFGSLVGALGVNVLAASKYLSFAGSSASLGLPADQWIAEMENFQAASMALVQRSAFSAIAGPSDPLLQQYIRPGNNSNEVWACHFQKFKSDAYASFSVLGLGLIFGVGGCTVLLGTFVTMIVPRLQRYSGKGEYRRRQWYSSNLLRLQRAVYEDRGLGNWVGNVDDDNDDVPITEDLSQVFYPFTTVETPNAGGSPTKELTTASQSTPPTNTSKVPLIDNHEARPSTSITSSHSNLDGSSTSSRGSLPSLHNALGESSVQHSFLPYDHTRATLWDLLWNNIADSRRRPQDEDQANLL